MSALPARLLAAVLAALGFGRRLCILTYHRVLPERDPLRPGEPSAADFDAQLAVLRGAFNVLRLDEAVERLETGRLPPRAVAITFDDGYRDNHDIALPILERHGLRATFFVATAYMHGGAMFNDMIIEAIRTSAVRELRLEGLSEPLPLDGVEARLRAIHTLLPLVKPMPLAERAERCREIAAALGAAPPARLMMTPEEVRALAARGMEIGAHTVHHPILSSLASEEAEREIADSRRELETLLGRSVAGFAYPNGRPGSDYASEHVEMVRRAGFHYAVSTRWASVWPQTPHYELPRIAPWDRAPERFALRVARGFAQR